MDRDNFRVFYVASRREITGQEFFEEGKLATLVAARLMVGSP